VIKTGEADDPIGLLLVLSTLNSGAADKALREFRAFLLRSIKDAADQEKLRAVIGYNFCDLQEALHEASAVVLMTQGTSHPTQLLRCHAAILSWFLHGIPSAQVHSKCMSNRRQALLNDRPHARCRRGTARAQG